MLFGCVRRQCQCESVLPFLSPHLSLPLAFCRNVYVICSQNARHKTKQKFSTLAFGSLPSEAAVAPAISMPLTAPSMGAGVLTSMGLPFWARATVGARGSSSVDGTNTEAQDEDVL